MSVYGTGYFLNESKTNETEWDILYKIFGDGNSKVKNTVKLINEEKYEELHKMYDLYNRRSIKLSEYEYIKMYSFIDSLQEAKIAITNDWKDNKEEIDWRIHKIKNGDKIELPELPEKTDIFGVKYIIEIMKLNKNNKFNICILGSHTNSDEVIICITNKSQREMLDKNKKATKVIDHVLYK